MSETEDEVLVGYKRDYNEILEMVSSQKGKKIEKKKKQVRQRKDAGGRKGTQNEDMHWLFSFLSENT